MANTRPDRIGVWGHGGSSKNLGNIAIFANDFINDTDYSENKAIACKARILAST